MAEFGQVMKDNGISEATVAILAEQGFISRDALSVMEVADIPALKLKQMAQKRLLERLVNKLKEKATTETPVTETSTVEPQAVTNQLDTLLGSSPVTTGRNITLDRGDLDPLVYLADNHQADYLDIVDFVPMTYHRWGLKSLNWKL